jgi:hypothetical protein
MHILGRKPCPNPAFWNAIFAADRFMIENAFFEHLGLVGGFLLVAWYDLRERCPNKIGE